MEIKIAKKKTIGRVNDKFLFANALRMTMKYKYHFNRKSEYLERKELWKSGEQERSNMGSFKLPWDISTINERTGCCMTLTLECPNLGVE